MKQGQLSIRAKLLTNKERPSHLTAIKSWQSDKKKCTGKLKEIFNSNFLILKLRVSECLSKRVSN